MLTNIFTHCIDEHIHGMKCNRLPPLSSMSHLQAQRNRSCDYGTNQSSKHHLWKYKPNVTSAANNRLPNMHPTEYMNHKNAMSP